MQQLTKRETLPVVSIPFRAALPALRLMASAVSDTVSATDLKIRGVVEKGRVRAVERRRMVAEVRNIVKMFLLCREFLGVVV